MEVTVKVEWEEESGTEKTQRPYGMVVQLYRDNELYGEPTGYYDPNLSEDNDWTYTWENLPDGDYMVSEVPGTAGCRAGGYFERAVIEKVTSEKIMGGVYKKNFILKKHKKNIGTGVVEISMKVKGKAAEIDREWNFFIEELRNHGCRYRKQIPGRDDEEGILTDGKSFTLRHNESITLFDFPMPLCVIYLENNNHGYHTTCDVNGKIGIRTHKVADLSYMEIFFKNLCDTPLSIDITNHRNISLDTNPEEH